MASRSRTLAAGIVTAINAWGSKPAGVTASRVRSVTHLLKDMPAATPGAIAVIASRSDDTSNRAEASEDITIGIVVIGNAESEAAAASDSWDDFTEALADYMRTSNTFRSISVGTISAARKAVNLVTIADADLLDEHEIFVSAIEVTYHAPVGARA